MNYICVLFSEYINFEISFRTYGCFDRTDHGEYSHSFDIAVSPNLTGRTPRSGRGLDKTKKKYVIASLQLISKVLWLILKSYVS